jgi:HK97 gp10 family phage protein
MANTLRFRWTGLRELQHAIKAYGPAVVRAAQEDVETTVSNVVERARAAAPVETGALRDSIKGSVRTDGYTIRGTVRVGVEYAGPVEFGTEDTPKQPHLVPASVAERKDMQARLLQSIADASPSSLGTPGFSSHDSPLPGIGIE